MITKIMSENTVISFQKTYFKIIVNTSKTIESSLEETIFRLLPLYSLLLIALLLFILQDYVESLS